MSAVEERGILSHNDRRAAPIRQVFGSLRFLVLVGLVVSSIGPLLWVSKAALSTPQDLIREPLSLFPKHGAQWSNITDAWFGNLIGLHIGNSVLLAAGCVVTNLIVCTCTAYVLSVLRPRWAQLLSGAILATLFIPGIILLVPLYLTVLNLPIGGVNLINTYWAVWLPAAANPFNVLVVKRFFDAIPSELFEAARIDGASSVRVLLSIALPLARPILGVVALLAAIGSWQDFLWPLVVLPDPAIQPVSVALTQIIKHADVSSQMAAVFLALLLPVAAFLIFQRQFMLGVALSGGIKE